MAPSSGHLLVPKAFRILKFAYDKTSAAIRSKLPQTSDASTSNAVLQPIRISSQTGSRYFPSRNSQSPSQHRWFSTSIRRQGSQVKAHGRSPFNSTKVGNVIKQRVAAPFASTLRPNLTGGALPRTANGYCLGGTGRGVRHFSQTPTCQAHVIQNVNAGIRAFFVGGGKARFDGVDALTGEKRFRSVTSTENEILDKFDRHYSLTAKGTNLEFRLSPTITALLPSSTSQTLDSANMLDALSVDFARALKDLSLTLSDLHRLSSLGNLPITIKASSKGPLLTVRFPGCDAETVSRLCEELGVFRGIVCQDEGWDQEKDVEMALLFPFAPCTQNGSEYFEHQATIDTLIAPEQVEWQGMMSPSIDIRTPDSLATFEDIGHSPSHDWTPSQSGFESLGESDFANDDPYLHYQQPQHHHHQQWAPKGFARSATGASSGQRSHGVEGLEAIYRFIQECDDARK